MTGWHKFALGTVPVVGACLCLLLFQVSSLVERVDRDEGTFAAQIQQALTTVNQECGPMVHCGTLAEVDKTLTHTSDLIVQTQLAVRHADRVSQTEAALLPEWNQRITGTLNGIDTAVGDFDGNQNKLTAAALPVFQQTEKTVADVDTTVQQTTVAVADLHKFLANPDLLAAVHNANTASLAISDTSHNVDSMTTDGKTWLHQKLFPTKKKGVADAFDAAGDRLHHWLPSIF